MRPISSTLSLFALAVVVVLQTIVCGAPALRLDRITLPRGFSIAVYANDIPDARSMTLAPDGTIFVGNRQRATVYAIVNKQVVTLARGLNTPNGVAFRDG